jgi:hypothetical protein
MSNHLRKCPKCQINGLVVKYAVIQRETCINCDYLTQRRVTPVVQGGLAMVTHLTDHLMDSNGHLNGLQAALQQQLAKVRRREAKLKHHGNGGSPQREEDWR